MTALNQTLTGPGSTAVHVANSETCLFALIAVTATSISAQLECGVGADWVPVSTPLTAIGSAVINVPNDLPLRATITGVAVTNAQVGIAT